MTRSSLHAQVWQMAGPIILANVSVPLLGAVDTAVVGHLPQPYYIGAVAIGAMLFNYIYHLFNCLRMGTTAPTAQARGAENHAEVRAIIGRALILATAIGCAIVALQVPIAALAFWLIDASAEVEHYGRAYFSIRVWSMPAVLASYAMIGWFYGLRNVRAPLVVQIATNVINIVLALTFVMVLDWGVPGVALATVVAEYSGLAMNLAVVQRMLRALPKPATAPRILDREKMLRLMAMNRDLVLRTLCVVSVLGFFMAHSAKLGDVTLAANQVLHHFLVFTSFALDGFAHAAETILGEAAGRRDRAGFRRAMRVVFLWAGIFGACGIAVYALFGPAIIALLTSIPEVRAAAADYLIWPVLMPLVSVWAYTYDGVYLAATQTRAMRNAVMASFALFLVTLYTLPPLMGNAALWLAVGVFLGGRGLLLHLASPHVIRSL